MSALNCHELLSDKIKFMMREHKYEGKYANIGQVLAIAYAKIKKQYPSCAKHLKKKE